MHSSNQKEPRFILSPFYHVWPITYSSSSSSRSRISPITTRIVPSPIISPPIPINSTRITTQLPLHAAVPDCTVAPRSRTDRTPDRAVPAPHPRTRPSTSRPESEGRSAPLSPPARSLHQTMKACEIWDCARSAQNCDLE